jgi:DNA-binding response OmpR family regulator
VRVLLVEDDPDLREVMQLALEEHGYVVEPAAGLKEAQAFLAAVPYRLVITDWRLPDGDGTLLALWATQLDAKAIVVSGFLRDMPGGWAEEHPTLMKPFRLNQLLEAVREAIGEGV